MMSGCGQAKDHRAATERRQGLLRDQGSNGGSVTGVSWAGDCHSTISPRRKSTRWPVPRRPAVPSAI